MPDTDEFADFGAVLGCHHGGDSYPAFQHPNRGAARRFYAGVAGRIAIDTAIFPNGTFGTLLVPSGILDTSTKL